MKTPQQRLSGHDLLTYILVIPFFIWSFLGGHKQIIAGYNSDHVISLLAIFGCIFVLINTRSISSLQLHTVSLYLLFIIFSISSINFTNPVSKSFNTLASHIGYFFISFVLSIFFKNRFLLFLKTVVFSTFFASCIILIFFLFLGMSSWGRMTIPVYVNGYFSYFPSGYSSSSDPNVLAYFLGFGILTLLFFSKEFKLWPVYFISAICALFLTFSRSAIFALSLCFLCFLYKKSLTSPKKNFLALFFILLIASLFICFRLPLYIQHLLDRFNDIDDIFNRLLIAQKQIEIIKNSSFVNIVNGHGIGYSSSTLDPHNFYLSTIVDTGLLSILFISIILFYILAKIKNQITHYSPTIYHYSFSVFSFFLIISVFYWQIRTYYFVILILLITSGLKANDKT